MKEGVNQGCPLSPIFATLVLHRVLKPLDFKLRQRAADRLARGLPGDDGFGSLTHLFAYMDDNIQFFCEEIERLGTPRGCFVNPFKTRILTSCNGESSLPKLHLSNSPLADTIKRTIATYSITKKPDDTTSPIELVDGFRLLGTPIGSPVFAIL